MKGNSQGKKKNAVVMLCDKASEAGLQPEQNRSPGPRGVLKCRLCDMR